MRMSKLVGKRIKEDPKDAQTVSHKFLIRGGYVRPVSAGIYSLLPIAKRVIDKIEAIIREEMNKVEGQEVLLPVVLPRELWEETGRYESVGQELLRFKDRNGKDMLLGMTHEEAVVHLFRTEVSSYKQLPAMLYQLQTKYRDEARPRAGLIRVREFTMKDAYSFHENDECLEEYYNRQHKSYERIFQRLGMPDVVSIESDAGMMGGSVSHEFMAIADCGEDTIFLSPDGKYKANKEVATSAIDFSIDKTDALELEKVHTPEKKTIEEVSEFLNAEMKDTGKAVLYTDIDGNAVFAMIRGDFEVNEAKLKKVVQSNQLIFANDDEIRAIGAEPGYASPMNLDYDKVKIVIDKSIAESSNLIVGANCADYHYKNFNLSRDLDESKIIVADIANARAGDPCPVTGEPLIIKRGIEVGNIFQLGTKYTKSMNCTYLDKNGKAQTPIMGCYGIGVGRSMASVIEQSHDNYGPIWPISIAPYQVQICAINMKKAEVKEPAEKLYADLLEKGIEVLFDDRGEKPGFMFSDADLIGIPFRFTISPKTVKENQAEFKIRGNKDFELLELEGLADKIENMVNEEIKKYK